MKGNENCCDGLVQPAPKRDRVAREPEQHPALPFERVDLIRRPLSAVRLRLRRIGREVRGEQWAPYTLGDERVVHFECFLVPSLNEGMMGIEKQRVRFAPPLFL